MNGTYLLIMDLPTRVSIQVGKLGMVDFQKGRYVYVGSALNGLSQRIQRHLRKEKKVHWHIDYLLPLTKIVDIYVKEGIGREECRMARLFEHKVHGIPGFGCSDCACSSHLFTGALQDIQDLVDSLGMASYPLHENP